MATLGETELREVVAARVPGPPTPTASNASSTLSTRSAGPSGEAATRPDPRSATTDDKPLKQQDHDLRLEHWPGQRGPVPHRATAVTAVAPG